MLSHIPLEAFTVEPQLKTSLFNQLYQLIQHRIQNADFPAQSLMPSSRILAKELSISRSTVTSVYEQLVAEGYLVSKRGSGTVVAQSLLPESGPENLENYPRKSLEAEHISNLAQTFISVPREYISYRNNTLAVSLPSRTSFPSHVWGKLLGKYAKKQPDENAGYDQPGGVTLLRTAIAKYLKLSRAVNTSAEDILILNSTQSAVDLLCRALLNTGDVGWVENPGYKGIHIAMKNADTDIHGIDIDSEGITISSRQPVPKVIYTTPSHQYPMGTTMSYGRRMELLNFANQQASWIIEDDYDSEFRYSGKPLPSLQGLDQHQQVIYLGTFSKTLSPSMRVAYLVSPKHLTPILQSMIADFGLGVNLTVQYALAEFIDQGHYSQHIRKTRQKYANKQQCLLNSLREHMIDKISIIESSAGLQTTVLLKNSLQDTEIVTRAKIEGLHIKALSPLYHSKPAKQGLIIGFASTQIEDIEPAIKTLNKRITRMD